MQKRFLIAFVIAFAAIAVWLFQIRSQQEAHGWGKKEKTKGAEAGLSEGIGDAKTANVDRAESIEPPAAHEAPELTKAKNQFPWATEMDIKMAIAQGVNLDMIERGVPAVRRQVANLSVAIKQYHHAFNVYPLGGNTKVAKALLGENPTQTQFIVWPEKSISPAGELLDTWGTPLHMSIGADGAIDIRSAGNDRKFITADDEVTKR